MAGEDILKAVFPFLDGPDLATCMLVSKQWQEIAQEDCLWKSLCLKSWPSICNRFADDDDHHSRNNPALFRQLFRKCHQSSNIKKSPLSPPRLSFDDLEFYIDIGKRPKKHEYPKFRRESFYSEIITGATLLEGIRNPPPGVCFATKFHLGDPTFKMAVPVEPRFTVTGADDLTGSVIVMRKDSGKFAGLIGCGDLCYLDRTECRAMTFGIVHPFITSPNYPFVPLTYAWISLLYLHQGDLEVIGDTRADEAKFEVFGIELDFKNCDFVNSEDEVLRLLDMLHWK